MVYIYIYHLKNLKTMQLENDIYIYHLKNQKNSAIIKLYIYIGHLKNTKRNLQF